MRESLSAFSRRVREWQALQARRRRGAAELRKLGLCNRPRVERTLFQALVEGFSLEVALGVTIVSATFDRVKP